MSVIKGENVVTFFFVDGVWKVAACARTCTLDVSTETIETTVSGSGKFKSFKPTVNSWSGSIDGVVFLNETGKVTLPDLRRKQLAHERCLIKYQRTDQSGNTYTDEGYFYITSSNDAGSYNDVNTFNLSFIGDGPLTITTTNISNCPVIYITFSDANIITANWYASLGATKYFYKITLAGNGEAIQQGETTGLTRTFGSLTADTAYTLYVYPFISGAYVNTCGGYNLRTDVTLSSFTIRWGWQSTDPTANMSLAIYQNSAVVALGGDAFIGFAEIIPEQYFYLEYANTEADYTFYDMGFLMNSVLPDQTFKRVTQGSKKYLVTRDQQTFTTPQIRFHR